MIIQPANFIAATNGSIEDGLMITAVGMAVVFIALVSIWGLLILLKNIVPAQEEKVTQAAPKPIEADQLPEQMDPELIAVLTATAIAIAKAPVRIKRVRYVPPGQGQAWAQHGRQVIHSSHRLRKGNQ